MKYFWGLCLLLIALVNPATPIGYGQENSVSAVVIIDQAEVYVAPMWFKWKFYSGYSKQYEVYSYVIGSLQLGATVQVKRWENIEGDSVGVYVVHPESGLAGWVKSEGLQISPTHWQGLLPSLNNRRALATQIVQDNPVGVPSFFTGGGGGYAHINVRAAPFYDAPLIGKIPEGGWILILGRAEINQTRQLRYVYVREVLTGLTGWVVDEGLVRLFGVPWYVNQGLPVVYQHDFYTEYASLPHVTLSLDVVIRRIPALSGEIVDAGGRSIRGEVVVHGRTNHEAEGWVYVTVLKTGISGWAFDPSYADHILYPDGFDRTTLPIVTP